MLTYSRSLKLSYLYGSAGGQIITKSNSRDTEKFQFDLYPSTGCKKLSLMIALSVLYPNAMRI